MCTPGALALGDVALADGYKEDPAKPKDCGRYKYNDDVAERDLP